MIVENIHVLGFVFFLVLLFIYFRFKSELRILSQKNSIADSDVQTLNNELLNTKQLLEAEIQDKQKIMREFYSLESDYKNLKLRLSEAIEKKKEDEQRFEFLANKILEQKTQSFDQQHKKGIKEILEPLKEKIKLFEEKVDSTNKESLERHSTLRQQIKSLTELNERITKEAVNLTRALKADNKQQGNWGELVLESILEKSGLERGREFHIQKSLHNDEGNRYQPDVIIDLPDSKKMIIDSKVSLLSYEKFINAENEDISNAAIKAHVLSIRGHIDNLTSKQYHELYKIESPDFVLMFIPIDTAFSCAIGFDQSLYQYAFERNIIIVTPATLLATLKTVDTMWQNDKQNKYALEIASEAGRMYDKFTGFVDDMEKLGRQIETVKTTYSESMKKMSNGSGNLIRRAEKLRQLGAKANKRLPSQLVEQS